MSRNIILIHGMWGTPAHMENPASHFRKAGWNVHVPALRHHAPGADLDALAATGVGDYADDLAALASSLDAPPVLLGHSMGGLLAQLVAARGKARACVLVTPAAPAGIFCLDPAPLISFGAILLLPRFWKRALPTNRDGARRVSGKLDEATFNKIYSAMVPESGKAFREMALWFLGKDATTIDPEDVSCPLLVLSGAHDKATPPDMVRDVARFYGDKATHRHYPDHSHGILWEDGWQSVCQDIESWLDALD